LQECRKRAVPVFEGNKDLIVFDFVLAYLVVGLINRSPDEERIRGL
jgi:hypothetical protein